MTIRTHVFLVTLLWTALGAIVLAQEPTDPATDDATAVGIEVDLGVASAYAFRGWNTFQQSGQGDQNAAFFPSVTWSLGDTGLYLGYWGAYQLTGSNKKETMDGALNGEQDVFAGYDVPLGKRSTLGLAVTYYFYPFADKETAGTAWPSFLEPSVTVGTSWGVDWEVQVSYFAGLGDAVSPLSYLYLRPGISTSLEVTPLAALDLGLGVGYKVWKDAAVRRVNDNAVDVAVDLGLRFSVPDSALYVAPAMHLVWTNIDQVAVADDPSTPEDESGTRPATVGDEFLVYGSINVGAVF